MVVYLYDPISTLFKQLENLLTQLTVDQYSAPIKVLSNSSVGQHVRHVIEFYVELNKGYKRGYVNYEERIRDRAIESDKMVAISKLKQLASSLTKKDKVLGIVASYKMNGEISHRVSTNYERELMYNLEHTVHHMALIRIGVVAVSEIGLPEDFGVAMSTIKFRNVCAR